MLQIRSVFSMNRLTWNKGNKVVLAILACTLVVTGFLTTPKPAFAASPCNGDINGDTLESDLGVPVCYPVNWDGNTLDQPNTPEVVDGVTMYKWQCVEFSARYLKSKGMNVLAVGQGKMVAQSYYNYYINHGFSNISMIYNNDASNGHPNTQTFPSVGDVYSTSSGDPVNGHTGVVSYVNITNASAGNATFYIEQQNVPWVGGPYPDNAMPIGKFSITNWSYATTDLKNNIQPTNVQILHFGAGGSSTPSSLAVFANGGNQQLYQNSLSNVSWTGWTSLGGVWPATSQPAVVTKTQNWLDVFQVGGDHALYHQWWNGSTWSSGWQSLGGNWPATSQPVVISKAPGNIDVFIVGPDQALYQDSLSGTTWSGWTNLGGVWPATSQPAVVAKTQNWLDVFLVGGDHVLYHQWWNGSTWSAGWQSLGGNWPATSQVSAVSKTQNWIDVFIVNGDQALYHNWLDSSNTWYGWQNLAGVWPSTSQPVAIAY